MTILSICYILYLKAKSKLNVDKFDILILNLALSKDIQIIDMSIIQSSKNISL